MITVLHDLREAALPRAQSAGDSLWLYRDDLEAATGWTWKPEGLCRDAACIPLPRQAASELVRGDQLDVAAAWRHMGHPVAHSADGSVWVLGTGAGARTQALESLDAPDIELPDLAGHLHRLSDYRGRKVFLATWASW